jgi:hypothetical protein
MKSIKVFIYSYKNENLLDQVKDIVSKQGNNKIIYHVYDQNNVNRDFLFNEIGGVNYNYIRWDDYQSITSYRSIVLLNGNPSEYYLEINPNVVLDQNWDEYLLDNLEDNTIISGHGIINLKVDGHKVIKDTIETNDISVSNYIDIDLIFCKYTDAMILSSLKEIKEFDQNLFASLIFVRKNYTIKSLPSNKYTFNIKNNNLWKAWSTNHGYNKFLEKQKIQNNDLFENFHRISVNSISPIPYQIDDVLYPNFKISIENLEKPRYLNGYKGVEIT